MSVSIDLNGKWKLSWEAHEGCERVPKCPEPIVGYVPGDVHEDLIRADILPEPLVGTNAPKHEWVEDALFTYERGFTVDSDFDRAELVFSGLDCFGDVYIDSQKVGESANAFVPFTFDVTSQIEQGQQQNLKVTVDTGVQWAKKHEPLDCKNDDNHERMYLRKPQFSFKWDWAPRLVTCGIWRDVELKLYRFAALRDVHLTPSFDGDSAVLSAKVQVEAFSAGDYSLSLNIGKDGQTWAASQDVNLKEGMNEVELSVRVDDVQRWFPVGYGEPALYDVSVDLTRAGESVDGFQTTYGFREVALKQEPTNGNEETFIINVNGIDVFCKGANWVPADSVIARVTDAKYTKLVEEAVVANFNMLRVWGGGIYEDKKFYDLCDRLGVMVWHDFMFACSEYPDMLDWFVDNVRDEAEKAVQMLRDHPSIVFWCGNNENDWLCGYNSRGEGKKMMPFPGRKIYHEVLPEACGKFDSTRPYWPSSPYGGDDPNGHVCGDRHGWNVSIILEDLTARADIRNYRTEGGKFSSEWGMISYALPQTILDYTLDDRIDLKSEAYKVHDNPFNAGVSETESLTDWYLKVGFGGIPEDELTYIYQTLAYQAMGQREAISSFRIRKFDCAGSLFWMYSDCWGTLGWTIIDYYLRRKPSFYWVRKAYAPLAVFVREEDGVARTYVVNDTLYDIPLTVVLEVGDMSGQGQGVAEDLTVPANSVAVGPEIECGPGYAYARIEKGDRVRAEDLVLTRLPGEMEIPEVNIDFDVKQAGKDLEVTVRSDGFGHFVYLDLPDGAVPTDNYFNLLPSRPKKIRVSNIDVSGEIGIGALNMKK